MVCFISTHATAESASGTFELSCGKGNYDKAIPQSES